ncbi:MAG: SPOR domain-containing protein [Alistipes sp.]
MFRIVKITTLLFAIIFGFEVLAQPVSPRISGLEGNGEYLALLREDRALQMREDSVAHRMEGVRQLFREQPEERERYGTEILQMEEAIFKLRSTKSKLIDRINIIEQNWVLAYMTGATKDQLVDTVHTEPSIRHDLPALLYHPYFKANLSVADYAALQVAQQKERQIVATVNCYADNYAQRQELHDKYMVATKESMAGDIYDKYLTVSKMGDVLNDSIAMLWSAIFDSKTYAYGYVLDKLRHEELLSQETEQLAKVQRQIASLQGVYASDALVRYFLQKQAVSNYELSVAKVLNVSLSNDSLMQPSIQYRLSKIELKQRSFIPYEPLLFTSKSKYNAQHPIPTCKVYEHGVIYRVLLGSFRSKQALPIFKGASPLAYDEDDQGLIRYYAGGFATKAEAEIAQNELLKKGFRKPELVVWIDGVAENVSQQERTNTVQGYRVEITGTQALSDPIKTAILKYAAGREISRLGQDFFVVGTFDDRAVATKVAQAVAQIDDQLEIKITETHP